MGRRPRYRKKGCLADGRHVPNLYFRFQYRSFIAPCCQLPCCKRYHLQCCALWSGTSVACTASQTKPWGAAVWTLPERTIQGFATAFNLEDIDHESVLAEVDAFAKSLIAAAGDTTLFVASWVLPVGFSGYGPLDWRPELGLKNLLARMNLRLAEKLAIASNIYMLDTDSWLAQIAAPLSPKMWYAAKVPFASKVFEKAAGDIISAIVAIKGLSRRLIVLDLDNTLWGGVIGETGWQGIRLGGHDHIGEAYKEFQKELKALSNRGIQLAIVSKNDENVALEALDNHGEMLLKRNDFAGWRINWHDKAANIVSLVEDIGLGLTSVVLSMITLPNATVLRMHYLPYSYQSGRKTPLLMLRHFVRSVAFTQMPSAKKTATAKQCMLPSVPARTYSRALTRQKNG